MLDPRWTKMVADAREGPGRVALMVAALAISVAALAAMLCAYALLGRAVTGNYLGTNPASAQLVVDKVDEATARAVRALPGIADAEVSGALRTRVVRADGSARPALLFVVPDLGHSRINVPRLSSGGWATTPDSIVLERTAVGVAMAGVGQSVVLEQADGTRRSLTVVGTVHDPSLAPASQEQAVYGYIAPASLATLGADTDLHILKVVVSRPDADTAAIEATARDVARWLKASGRTVREIRVPPPRTHPHQSQMMTVLAMLLMFSALGLVLGSALGATIVGGMLAAQARDIAVMKAVGARTRQVAWLYVAMVGCLALLAVAIGTPLGFAAGRAWALASAQLLNLDLGPFDVPSWALIVNALVGVLVPVGAALIPIVSASRRTVREAMGDAWISRRSAGADRLGRGVARIRLLAPSAALGLRNAFRRRGRLALTIALLAVGGAVFMASAELRIAWYANIAASAAARHYDLEIGLQRPVPEGALFATLSALPGVAALESWPASAVNVDSGDHIAISRTYPDEGHGRIALRAAPASTRLIDVHLSAGRWLAAGDVDAVVINSAARAAAFPNATVGDSIDLLIRQQPRRVRVVGMTREIMSPPTIYTTPSLFHGDDFASGSTNAVRLTLAPGTAIEATAAAATRALTGAGIPVQVVITEKLLSAAQGGHVGILVFALGFIALTLAAVGALGLASMLSSNVTERTREFGILRAIGARGADIRRIVIAEAIVGAALGAGLAIPVAVPIAAVVGRVVARISAQPLQLGPALSPILIWFAVAIVAASTAALYPAVRAARLTVREALAIC